MRNDPKWRSLRCLERPCRQNVLLAFVKQLGDTAFVGRLIRILSNRARNSGFRYNAGPGGNCGSSTDEPTTIDSHGIDESVTRV